MNRVQTFTIVTRDNSKTSGGIEMRNRKSIAVLVALAFMITLMTAVAVSAQNATNTHPLTVPQGEKRKIQGVVSLRNGETYKVRNVDGGETTVSLTASTGGASGGGGGGAGAGAGGGGGRRGRAQG